MATFTFTVDRYTGEICFPDMLDLLPETVIFMMDIGGGVYGYNQGFGRISCNTGEFVRAYGWGRYDRFDSVTLQITYMGGDRFSVSEVPHSDVSSESDSSDSESSDSDDESSSSSSSDDEL